MSLYRLLERESKNSEMKLSHLKGGDIQNIYDSLLEDFQEERYVVKCTPNNKRNNSKKLNKK